MSTSDPVECYLTGAEQGVSAQSIQQVIYSYTGSLEYHGPIPREYRSVLRPSLEVVFSENMTLANRNAAIADAHIRFGYTLAEIGKALGLHPASVSRIFSARR
jgi:hypothetical protein